MSFDADRRSAMRLAVPTLACLCLLSAPASASGQAGALDLTLPAQSQAGYSGDPPGTWYGDTSGVPADSATTALASPRLRPGCPTAPDGQETDLTGSVAMGLGHTSGLGSSRYGGATLNYCKSYGDDAGGARTINVQMNVNEYEGPGPWMHMGPGHGPAPGPWPRGRTGP